MSDSPTGGLSPLMDMRVKLTKAEARIKVLEAENWSVVDALNKAKQSIERLTEIKDLAIKDCMAEAAENEQLHDRIKVLEEKNSYLKTWGHNQYGNLKDRIKELESQLESGMDGQSMLPTELLNGMHIRIAKLGAAISYEIDTAPLTGASQDRLLKALIGIDKKCVHGAPLGTFCAICPEGSAIVAADKEST